MTDTALVLGAGGVTGSAWETGILHGLAKAGVDLSAADLIIGSSAGAVVGAQLASGLLGLPELYELQLADPQDMTGGRLGPLMLLRYAGAVLSARTPEAYGRKLGRIAQDARPGITEEQRREAIASRLLSPEWPGRPLLVTAVDATTGELHTFDRDGEVSLVDAVTASCAVPGVWPVTRIQGRTWIDGGVHSTANAQLAAGYGRVVVIAPSASGNKAIASPRSQAAALAADGARVEVITPDAAAKKAFGRNPLDPSCRAAAARAGLEQSAAHTEAVATVLSS
ncbi:patatin-like phospholipase family protein [Streptomyces sp. NBC_00378]|uniref:patatin-like phospholipase family protein n=1 Tax=unclassified Streptomyces TaxID=2593676 RepID=UPI002253F7B9|nr:MULTISPECIES: patatin-like phospholipase family protein [unclassified Streptomyces]MCX5113296.1 patatin-like phospholipase family protein [Streptomyces sp. NBC_00378]